MVWMLCVIATANATTQHALVITRNLNYTVQILGIDNVPLKKKLESVSNLIRWQDRPPESQIRLEQRVQSDLGKMRLLLRSEGYYSGSLDYRIDSDQTPLKVALTVDTGPLYVLRDFRVHYQGVGPANPGLPWRDTDYPLTEDQAARAQFVIDARNKVLDLLTEIGYPNAQLIDQNIIVEHKTAGMTVNLKIEPG